MRADRRNILLCVALYLAAIAVANPVLEMGTIDDWSYTHIAREFADTGRIGYNGWASAMLIPQILWSAVFLKLFGFSFLAVRLSTIVLGVFLIPVLYFLGRESGLDPPFALFGTLLCALSPLFLPIAASFMSDVPGFFLFALCFYAGVRCWNATTTKACAGWALLVALTGELSGLDRQPYWIAPLSFLPVIAWIQRGKKGAAPWLGIAWLATVLTTAYFELWLQAKPYSASDHSLDWWKRYSLRFIANHELFLLLDLGLTAGLVLLPLLIGYVKPGFRAVTRRNAAIVLAGVAAAGAVAVKLPHHAVPSLGNVLTEYGILGARVAALGVRPMILRPGPRELLTVLVLLACAGCAMALWKLRSPGLEQLRQCPIVPSLILGLVFTAIWLPAVLFRSLGTPAWDRYLISFFPLVAIPLLRFYQTHIGTVVSRLSWAVLTVFAVYGVATTHDAFAAGRARLTAARALEQAGIPRTEISGGFEYDGWTQLETAGFVNDWKIDQPSGPSSFATCTGPRAARPWFFYEMPVVRARYFVVYSRLPELDDAPAAPVGYTTWLPPGRRQILTQVVRGGGYAGCNDPIVHPQYHPQHPVSKGRSD